MRVDNVVLVVVCSGAIAIAALIGWRGRRLSIVRPTVTVQSASASALDALRSVVCVFSAAFIAGVLVVGLGGRLVMRILAATSGDSVQGTLTEAQEAVGVITFGGTMAFVVFVGIGFSLLASFVYLALRQVLPSTSWVAGIGLGIILLGTFGVADPISPENVDFVILSPRWFAVALVAATALLFGMTFTALAARFDQRVPSLAGDPSTAPIGGRLAYCALVFLIIPVLLVPAGVYIALRAAARGRLGVMLDRPPVRAAGRVALAALVVIAVGLVIGAAVDII